MPTLNGSLTKSVPCCMSLKARLPQLLRWEPWHHETTCSAGRNLWVINRTANIPVNPLVLPCARVIPCIYVLGRNSVVKLWARMPSSFGSSERPPRKVPNSSLPRFHVWFSWYLRCSDGKTRELRLKRGCGAKVIITQIAHRHHHQQALSSGLVNFPEFQSAIQVGVNVKMVL